MQTWLNYIVNGASPDSMNRTRPDVPVNRRSIDALVSGDLEPGPEKLAYFLINNYPEWRAAFEKALVAKQRDNLSKQK